MMRVTNRRDAAGADTYLDDRMRGRGEVNRPRLGPDRSRSCTCEPRSGLVLITVLVCLVIVCGVATAALRVAILAVGQTRVDERASQAEWLAEAGLEWSRAKLKGDSAWTGETWRVSAAALSQPSGGEVVATIATAGSSKVLRVVARYPAGEAASNPVRPGVTARLERPLADVAPEPPKEPAAKEPATKEPSPSEKSEATES
jgi:type II secretory pathway pseudopilin PulG